MLRISRPFVLPSLFVLATVAAFVPRAAEAQQSRRISDLDLDLDRYFSDIRLVQAEALTQPESAAETSESDQPTTRPTPPRPTPPRRPAFNLLAGAPNMYGDLFDGGGGMVTFTPPPIVIQQTWTDGTPFDLFVRNPLGFGANANPAVPIFIDNGQGGALIAQSIGNGIDTNGDGQPDTYPISEPVGSSPGAGFMYSGGNAIFPDPTGNSVGNPDGWTLAFSHTLAASGPVVLSIPAGGGAGVRRVKLSENNSPQPRDRVFFNYNFFNDVIGGFGDVNRYTLGAEKTFFDGTSSLELRVPFASTLASDQTAPGGQFKDTEIGNITFIFKTILFQQEAALLAGGVGMTVPFSDPTRVFLANGRQILQWNSESVHFLPYLAALSTPNERWFWQTFLQLDIDANGNSVAGNLTGGPLQDMGVIQDATLLFVDVGGGYRIYENPQARHIRRASAVAELHYSTTLQDADFAASNGFVVGSFTNRFDVLNLTMGVNMLTRNNVSIRPAMAIPLRNGDDKQFDYEALLQVNVQL